MKKEFEVIAILAGISLLLEGCSTARAIHEEIAFIDASSVCEEIKAENAAGEETNLNIEGSKIGEGFVIAEVIEVGNESDDIAEESHPYIELGATMEIPLEVGARVIVEYPDGEVYEFFGEEYEITDNSITVFFEKECLSDEM